ncbi:ATP-binding protein [Phenylobacterium koreense]|uniref:histidine kinase n=1 Tax=Phenylobacterium koreense TaxID=266125 RepID=A0ABV2EJU5_9CAUL
MTAVLLDLIQPLAAISPETQGQHVYDRFQAEPDTLAIAVVDEAGRPVGLVERHAFFVAMAAHYGRALYALRPISLLMNPDPLVAEGDTRVAEFCGEVLADRASEVMKGFVVVSGGRYAGVGSSLSLLQATNAANRAHAEEMTRLAQTLDRAKQEAQAALSAKSQFLAVMSHEIRTPLNGVLAIADILQRKLSEPELKPYVTTIQDSGQTLLRLLTDALDLSRADAGQLELAEDSFCVPALLDDLSALWTARAELKGLSLEFAYEGAAGQWALGDVVRIKQVFNNLIGNALKFTQAGGVKVRLAARRQDIHVLIEGEVRDSGVGVPADRLERIFQPFSQTEAGVREGGAGLGLSICRQLVVQMGGEIHVVSDGGGATFRFSFPLFDLPEPTLEEIAAEPDLSGGAGGLHILIADDNATNRLVAETLCEMFGCTTECVEDGEQAVAAAATGRFDLVLMDIKMPNMDGVAATRRIRGLAGAAAQVPILALTANADPWDAAGYLAQGMDGVVEKPIKAERLLGAINAVFEDEAPSAAMAG